MPLTFKPSGVWEIGSLPFETDPLIEAGFRLIGFGTHVPLAEKSRFVAYFLQIGRKEDGALWNGGIVIDDAMAVRIDTGENGSATGAAERGGDESVFEMNPFMGEAVELRSFKPRLSFHEAESVVTMIVAQDEDDVARFGEFGSCGSSWKCGTGGKGGEHLATIHSFLWTGRV